MDEVIRRAVERAIVAMRGNLGGPLTIDDLARAANFSKFHFTRIFQGVTGIPPGRFLWEMRVEQAKEMLASTSLTVADISVRVGYSSVGTFSSRFSRSVGMPPAAYRRHAAAHRGGTVAPCRCACSRPGSAPLARARGRAGARAGNAAPHAGLR